MGGSSGLGSQGTASSSPGSTGSARLKMDGTHQSVHCLSAAVGTKLEARNISTRWPDEIRCDNLGPFSVILQLEIGINSTVCPDGFWRRQSLDGRRRRCHRGHGHAEGERGDEEDDNVQALHLDCCCVPYRSPSFPCGDPDCKLTFKGFVRGARVSNAWLGVAMCRVFELSDLFEVHDASSSPAR